MAEVVLEHVYKRFGSVTAVQDFNLEAYRPVLQAQGMGANADTLGWFTSVGLRTYEGQPKPALATWDSTRSKSP